MTNILRVFWDMILRSKKRPSKSPQAEQIETSVRRNIKMPHQDENQSLGKNLEEVLAP